MYRELAQQQTCGPLQLPAKGLGLGAVRTSERTPLSTQSVCCLATDGQRRLPYSSAISMAISRAAVCTACAFVEPSHTRPGDGSLVPPPRKIPLVHSVVYYTCVLRSRACVLGAGRTCTTRCVHVPGRRICGGDWPACSRGGKRGYLAWVQ